MDKNQVTMWVARNKDGGLCVFDIRPDRFKDNWFPPLERGGNYFHISPELFPEVKWEDDEPAEAVLILRIMTKKEINERYKKLINSIETTEIYDGRNTIDKYKCIFCGNVLYVGYKDKGSAPFAIRCERCGYYMHHSETYNKKYFPEYLKIREWFRPSLAQTLKLPIKMIKRVLDGELILKKEK